MFRGNTRYPVRGKKAYPGTKQKQDPASSEEPSEAWGFFYVHQPERQEGPTEEAKVGAAQAVRAFAGSLAAGRQWNEDWWGMGGGWGAGQDVSILTTTCKAVPWNPSLPASPAASRHTSSIQ